MHRFFFGRDYFKLSRGMTGGYMKSVFLLCSLFVLYGMNVIAYALFPEYAGISFRLFASLVVSFAVALLVTLVRRSRGYDVWVENQLEQAGHASSFRYHVHHLSLRMMVMYMLLLIGVYEFVRPRLIIPFNFTYAVRHHFGSQMMHNWLVFILFSLVVFASAGFKNKLYIRNWTYQLILIELAMGLFSVVTAFFALTVFLRLLTIIV